MVINHPRLNNCPQRCEIPNYTFFYTKYNTNKMRRKYKTKMELIYGGEEERADRIGSDSDH